MIYYQYILDANNVIIGIQSSNEQFSTRQITLEKIKKIKVGRTIEQELIDMA